MANAAENTTTDQTTQNTVTNTIIAASATSTMNIGTASMSSSSAHVSPALEPSDKRMRTSTVADSHTSGAEDAEALVGFLRSVRASAAAGQEL